ncbi:MULTISPECIES: HEAT repeat domain-containing protein [Streptomyces]|uniref:HEAT repeat domain-containing protein n=1 Tax=Streptomyces desertarenae TaxID=2666184 RepID=A0ABW4PJA1_9ACTN
MPVEAAGNAVERVDGELVERLRAEAEPAAYERLLALARRGAPGDRDALAAELTAPGRPLWARELAACSLGRAGDRRAFETLVFLLNHRDPARCAAAARALLALGDPRTARAAAALADNELRVSYALHAVRLLAALRSPLSAPTLIRVLDRLLASPCRPWPVARACVEGLGELGDARARLVLLAAREREELRAAADGALRRL